MMARQVRLGVVGGRRSGHGGGDLFVIEDFVDTVLTGRRPPIDVYDAVTWSAIVPLSIESVAAGGRPVPVPNFRRSQAGGDPGRRLDQLTSRTEP